MEVLKIRHTFILTTIGYLIAMLIGLILPLVGATRSLLIISVIWMIVTILTYFYVKSIIGTKIVILMNFIVSELTIAAYYSEITMTYSLSILVVLFTMIIMVIEYFIMINANDKRTIAIFANVIIGMVFVFWLFRWYGGDVVLGSAIVFACIVMICMNISIYYFSRVNVKYSVSSLMKLSSMLIFGGVLAVIIAAISDGEVFELPAELLDSTKSKKNTEPLTMA